MTFGNVPYKIGSSIDHKTGLIVVDLYAQDFCNDFQPAYRNVARMAIDTMDQVIRQRLMELGWKPPENNGG